MTSRGGSWGEALGGASQKNSFSGFCIGLLVGFLSQGGFPEFNENGAGDFDNNFVFSDYYLMWTHCLPVESKMIEMHRGKMLA